MKFSREYTSEEQARQREAALLALGVQAWRSRKADGAWEVFWFVRE